MYDRPSAEELIDAARMHLEAAVIPAIRADRKLYFQTLVAINVLKIVQREMALGEGHVNAEWERLNEVEGVSRATPASPHELSEALADRNAALCADIRAGKYDADNSKSLLFEHVKACAIAQLEVANPRLLQTMADEDANPERDAWHNRNV
jgi:hypothetical protein